MEHELLNKIMWKDSLTFSYTGAPIATEIGHNDLYRKSQRYVWAHTFVNSHNHTLSLILHIWAGGSFMGEGNPAEYKELPRLTPGL